MTYTESQRARYMRGDITFHEYYGLLVELLGEDALRRSLPINRTPAQWLELIAADKHLNNVSLKRWDQCHKHVLALLRHVSRDALTAINGTSGWSLSDSVCVLKTTARRYADQARED
jgi:hypothetical protein